MKQRRPLLIIVVIVLLLVGSGGMWLWQTRRQYALNRQLIAALMKNDGKTAIVLVNAGADPNAHMKTPPAPSLVELWEQWSRHEPLPVDDSPTAFLFACGSGWKSSQRDDSWVWMSSACDVALIQAMLLHGADINAQTDEHKTALHVAVGWNDANQTRVEELLLEHHADTNASDAHGWTPLMLAAKYNRPKTVRLLLKLGANVQAKNDTDETALHLAVDDCMNEEIIRQLLAYGADPNQSGAGGTAIQIARDRKFPDIVALLRKGGK